MQLTGADAEGTDEGLVGAVPAEPRTAAGQADFLAVYPHVTTIRGTTFRFRGGDPNEVAKRLEPLLTRHSGKSMTASARSRSTDGRG